MSYDQLTADVISKNTRLKAQLAARQVDCRTCKWLHQPGDSPIAGCISHGRCTNGDRYQALPPVRLWGTV